MMKTIHRIYYLLFAIILLGMFASFAQNEYSSILLSYPYLFLGLLFFIETIFLFKKLREQKTTTLFLFLECLALGLMFCGTFLMTMHRLGATFFMVAGGLILLMLYTGFGIKTILKNFSQEKEMSLLVFTLALGTCLAILAYSFRLQHQAIEGFLTVLSGFISFVLFLLLVINVKIPFENEKVMLRDFLRHIKTKLVLSFLFFSFWTIYFTLVSFGIAPKLYSLANPPALEKMYREQNPAADVYRKNYQHFLDNWKTANNIQPDKSSSKK